MFPRKRLDWSLTDVLTGLWFAMTCRSEERARAILRTHWGPNSIPLYSVRTGWDALLRAMPWEPGDTIAMSAITIPHMRDLAIENGFEVAPVDVHRDSLSVDLRELEQTFKRTSPRAFVFVHLFGSRTDLTDVRAICDRYDVLLIEDCAQSFIGFPEFDPIGDVTMYSFGTIKTATAMGGAMFVFRDIDVLEKVRRAAEHPRQSRWTYVKKLVKSVAFLALANRTIFAMFTRLTRDHDAVIRNMSRGFSGDAWLQKIRRSPHPALLEMLAWRCQTYRPDAVWSRRVAGEYARDELPIVGRDARRRTHWLLAVTPDDPEAFVVQARRLGFDATRGTSVLCALGGESAAQTMERVVYLPCYDEMDQMAYRSLAAWLPSDANKFVEAA